MRRIPPMPFSSHWGRALIRTALRLIPSTRVDGVNIVNRNNFKPGLRIYHPDVHRSDGALYWIHGGGHLIGYAAIGDSFCSVTAREIGIVDVSVDYRLAAEYPFPAPLDDCYASRQWLFRPKLNDRTAANPELHETDNFVWNNHDNATGWRAHLAQEPGAENLPRYMAAARREHLTASPPAWLALVALIYFSTKTRSTRNVCGQPVSMGCHPAQPVEKPTGHQD